MNFIDLNAADTVGKAAKISKRGMHAKAFERIEVNGDGRVTPDEFAKLKR